MNATQSTLSEAEVIKDLLDELVSVRRDLLVTVGDRDAYREMVQIQTEQLHLALARITRQDATIIRLRDELRQVSAVHS